MVASDAAHAQTNRGRSPNLETGSPPGIGTESPLMFPKLDQLECGGSIQPNAAGKINEPIAAQLVMRASDVEPIGLGEPFVQGLD